MKKPRTSEAMTFVEALVVLSLVGVLFLVWFPPRMGRPRKSPAIKCVNNLKNIGLSARIFATDHGDKFPSQVSINEGGCAELVRDPEIASRYFRCLSNELSTPLIVVCPYDTRKEAADFSVFRNENLSYFVGWTASPKEPQALLAGDRGIGSMSGWVDLGPNSKAEWHGFPHGKSNPRGSILLGDGSVKHLSSEGLQQHLREGEVTNRVVIP